MNPGMVVGTHSWDSLIQYGTVWPQVSVQQLISYTNGISSDIMIYPTDILQWPNWVWAKWPPYRPRWLLPHSRAAEASLGQPTSTMAATPAVVFRVLGPKPLRPGGTTRTTPPRADWWHWLWFQHRLWKYIPKYQNIKTKIWFGQIDSTYSLINQPSQV